MKRLLFVLLFVVGALFPLTRPRPVKAILSCYVEGGVCCSLSNHTCSSYSGPTGFDCGASVCCWTTCVAKTTPTPTPTRTPTPTPSSYTCTTKAGQWCSPEGCDFAAGECAGSGTCAGVSKCCKVCPTPTPIPMPCTAPNQCVGLSACEAGGTIVPGRSHRCWQNHHH